jgi:hypothetical protein
MEKNKNGVLCNSSVLFSLFECTSNTKNGVFSWVPVAHACSPSYSGGKDQEDIGLKPVWANSLKIPTTKKKGW